MTDLDKYKSLVEKSVRDGIYDSEYDEMVFLYGRLAKAEVDAKKWDNLMTHTKYENMFGCAYHFELKESNRKNQFLQSEIQQLKQNQKTPDDVEKIKQYDEAPIVTSNPKLKCETLEKEIQQLKEELEFRRTELGGLQIDNYELKRKLVKYGDKE